MADSHRELAGLTFARSISLGCGLGEGIERWFWISGTARPPTYFN